MATKLTSYLAGSWIEGEGDGTPLVDPVLGTTLATASTIGIDMGAGVDFARRKGGPNLRAMTYARRAAMIRAIADKLMENYESYKDLALQNSGNTSADADIDVGGAIATLKYYARLGQNLGEVRVLRESDTDVLSKDGTFNAIHVKTPRQGVAIHINAFNFPAWGLWEKAAVALLSGMPVIAKPATATCLLSQAMVSHVLEAEIVPEGALSLVCGGVGDLLDHVSEQDVVAFTGSSATAKSLRAHPVLVSSGARLTVEADSVNACVLGPDAGPDSAEFALFVKEVAREMSTKAGQKCTAIRRAFVPTAYLEAARDALVARLSGIAVGNPRNESVRMGPVVNKAQQADVLAAIGKLAEDAEIVAGGDGPELVDAVDKIGSFVAPTLLLCANPKQAKSVHDIEAFGPVSTLMPYDDKESCWEMVAAGRGCLVTSVFTADSGFAAEAIEATGAWNGRLLFVNEAVAKSQTGHGMVMPMCVHGGPGRAGGGEELGGHRGLDFYHQRTAVQGEASLLEELFKQPDS